MTSSSSSHLARGYVCLANESHKASSQIFWGDKWPRLRSRGKRRGDSSWPKTSQFQSLKRTRPTFSELNKFRSCAKSEALKQLKVRSCSLRGLGRCLNCKYDEIVVALGLFCLVWISCVSAVVLPVYARCSLEEKKTGEKPQRWVLIVVASSEYEVLCSKEKCSGKVGA